MILLVALLGLQLQTSQADLCVQIRSSDPSARTEAVRLTIAIPLAAMSRELQKCLANELLRASADVDSLQQRPMGSVTPETIAAAERYQFALVDAINQSIDASVLPALAAALNAGTTAIRGIAKFGEAGIEPAASVALAGRDVAAANALLTLKLIIEGSHYSPLSREGLQRIKYVALTRLSGRQPLVIAMVACDLAVATKDQTLRSIVTRLAASPQEAATLGLVGWQAELLNRRAKQALQK